MKLLTLLHRLLILGILMIGIVSCNQDSDTPEDLNGTLQIGYSKLNVDQGRLESDEIPYTALVTLRDDQGSIILDKEEIKLIRFNDSYLTHTIELTIGSYELTEFLIMNEEEEIIYATPIEGSPKADLIEYPLPFAIEIGSASASQVTLEVITTQDSSPEDFGYLNFDFSIVDLVEMKVAVFTQQDNQVTQASSEIQIETFDADGHLLITKQISSAGITETVQLNPKFQSCQLTIRKFGYEAITEVFTREDLESKDILTFLLETEPGLHFELQMTDTSGYDSVYIELINDSEYFANTMVVDPVSQNTGVLTSSFNELDGTFNIYVTIFRHSSFQTSIFFDHEELLSTVEEFSLYETFNSSRVYNLGSDNQTLWKNQYRLASDCPEIYMVVPQDPCDLSMRIAKLSGIEKSCPVTYADRVIIDKDDLTEDGVPMYAGPYQEFDFCTISHEVEFEGQVNEYLEECNNSDHSEKLIDAYLLIKDGNNWQLLYFDWSFVQATKTISKQKQTSGRRQVAVH